VLRFTAGAFFSLPIGSRYSDHLAIPDGEHRSAPLHPV
jgi:hypothetical protein